MNFRGPWGQVRLLTIETVLKMLDPGGNTPPDQVVGRGPFTRLLRFAYREIKAYELAKACRAKAKYLVIVRDNDGTIVFTQVWDEVDRSATEIMYQRDPSEHACLLESLDLRPKLVSVPRKAA